MKNVNNQQRKSHGQAKLLSGPAWNKIFPGGGNSLIVALDHTPSGIMKGWEYPAETLSTILEGKPDAIMSNYGIFKIFKKLIPKQMGKILRLDGGPSYLLEEWPYFSQWGGLFTVQDAYDLGVDAVIVNIFWGGQVEMDSLQFAARVAADCFKLGMPCAIEPIVVHDNKGQEGGIEILSFAARMASEIGADFVKVSYSGDCKSFGLVTSRCPVPVLTAGGPKLTDDEHLLASVKGSLDGGGRGVFMGRNVWQHKDPISLLRALRSIIHHKSTVASALVVLRDRRCH